MLGLFLHLIQVKVVLLERRLGRLTNQKRYERGKGPKRLDWIQDRSAVSETEMWEEIFFGGFGRTSSSSLY